MNFEPTAVTVGNFDGVHRGHRTLLQRVADIAAQHRLRPVIVTFWPHPRQKLDDASRAPLLLNTLDERLALLKQTGIDDVLLFPFDDSLSQMTASDFLRDLIVGKLNVQRIVVGQDHHFGRGRGGNVQSLSEMVKQNNINVDVVDLKALDRKISSSAIRSALLCGDLELANEMLGYQYVISGRVVAGNQIGRTIGFPTANIETPAGKLLPKTGVYRAKVKIGSEPFDRLGMMYIGKRTALKQPDDATHVEVHIIGFDQQIYDQTIALSLTHRIRSDMQFDDVEQLAEQLRCDRRRIMEIK